MKARPSEHDIITHYLAPFAGQGSYGLTDDVAYLKPQSGTDLVFNTDSLVAGVHFFNDDSPASIARKLLGVNLSDLAAKAATPRGFLLNLALPPDWQEEWLHGFCQGLKEFSHVYDCPLLGGDTVKSSALVLSLTAIGEVPEGRHILRSRAKAGDGLYLSGTLGDAALGLKLRQNPDQKWAVPLSKDQRNFLVDRYLHPQPRLKLTPALRNHANASMDVSDGLAGDLMKLTTASQVRAVVQAEALPLSIAAQAALGFDDSLLETIVTGGDDYEVLCTISPEEQDGFVLSAANTGIAVTRIGSIVEGAGLPVFERHGKILQFPNGSYQHF